jgi:ABC-type Zn uptake system ZnuABC Zn-binding protein ZnuA
MDKTDRFWAPTFAWFSTFVFLAYVLGTSGCGAPTSAWTAGKSPRVLASFPPIYCFAANVIDPDRGEVRTLMAEKDPHHFNTTIQDALLLREADFFFINGLGLDDAIAERMIQGAGNTKLKTVKLGDALPEKEIIAIDKVTDPHAWLGLPEACRMVETIRDSLSAKDPEHAKTYAANAAAYIERLKKLHEEGKQALATVKPEDRKIISFHDSLRYFARALDLEVAGVVEYQPGTPATGQQIQTLLKICKEQHVRFIISEPLYDLDGEARRLQDNLRDNGVEVEIVEIDPLETALLKDLTPDYYEKVMRKNIRNLADKMTGAKK